MGQKKAQTTKRPSPPKRGSSPTVRERSSSETKAKASRKGAKTQSAAKSFSPTLGDIDLHLFGEGKHERIYERLGAHCRTHENKRGVSFAVWAPAADQVSVVGNFNGWDAAKHPMRGLGSSGVWERFIPGLRGGELYKYAITTAGKQYPYCATSAS